MTTEGSQTIALITGANKGLGFAAARQLGALGITVLVGARDDGRGQAAAAELRVAGVDAHYLPLDVTDAASIQAAAGRIAEDYGRLDILVNNAGVSLEQGRAPSAMPIEAVRRTYETNVFGVVAVTNALLPLLRRVPAARVVNMSSSLGSLTRAAGPRPAFGAPDALAYNSSKAALNALTLQYANELRDTPIKVNAADPGYCATDFTGGRGRRSAMDGARIAVRLATLPGDGPSGAFLDDDGPIPW